MKRKINSISLIFIIVFTVLMGCGNEEATEMKTNAQNAMEGASTQTLSEAEIKNEVSNKIADFSIELFKNCLSEDENTLISPYSVISALAMVSNGADGETRKQFEDNGNKETISSIFKVNDLK